jgi:nucleoside-diphosphate-sugar epimerase
MFDGSRQRILLTGSTGTVGSAVLALFASDPRFEVHAIVRRHQGTAVRSVEHLFDLSKDDFVGPLSSLEFDAIIDCAQPRYEESGTWQHFGVAYLKKLEALCGSRTSRLIHTGGVWVYGSQRKGALIDENSPLNPLAYARPSLPILDYLSRSDRYPWVQLCLPSIVYGSRGPLVGIKRALAQGSAVVIDDPSIECSAVERTDLARAYLAVLESPHSERLFLVAEPSAVSRLDMYSQVARILSLPFSPKPGEVAAKELSREEFEVASANQPVDSRLIRTRTAWTSKFTFAADVRRLLSTDGPV